MSIIPNALRTSSTLDDPTVTTVRSLDLHASSSSSWSQQLLDASVRIIQGHVKEEQDYVIGRRKR
jgi:hypothetical protein